MNSIAAQVGSKLWTLCSIWWVGGSCFQRRSTSRLVNFPRIRTKPGFRISPHWCNSRRKFHLLLTRSNNTSWCLTLNRSHTIAQYHKRGRKPWSSHFIALPARWILPSSTFENVKVFHPLSFCTSCIVCLKPAASAGEQNQHRCTIIPRHHQGVKVVIWETWFDGWGMLWDSRDTRGCRNLHISELCWCELPRSSAWHRSTWTRP